MDQILFASAQPHSLNPSPQQWGEGLLSPSLLLGRTPRGRVGMGSIPNNILRPLTF